MQFPEMRSFAFDLSTGVHRGDQVALGLSCNRLANREQDFADSSSVPFLARLHRCKARFWRVAAVRAFQAAACKGVL